MILDASSQLESRGTVLDSAADADRVWLCLWRRPWRFYDLPHVVLMLVLLPAQFVTGQEDGTATGAAAAKQFFTTYCMQCHGSKGKGDLQIDQIDEDIIHGKDSSTWRDILDRLNFGDMPPKNAPQPKQDELFHIIDYLTAQLQAAEKANNPMRTAKLPRRLTAYEYRHTIRDLLGYHGDPCGDFASDPTVDGFKNNAGALRMSGQDLERYTDAADRVLTLLSDQAKSKPKSLHWLVQFRHPHWPMSRERNKKNLYGFPTLHGKAKSWHKLPIAKGTSRVRDVYQYVPRKDLALSNSDYRLIDKSGSEPVEFRWNTDLRIFSLPIQFRKGPYWFRKFSGFRWYGEQSGTYRLTIDLSLQSDPTGKVVIPEARRHVVVKSYPEGKLLACLTAREGRQRHELVLHCDASSTYQPLYGYPGWGIDMDIYHRHIKVPQPNSENGKTASKDKGGDKEIAKSKVRDKTSPKSKRKNLKLKEISLGIHIHEIEIEGPLAQTNRQSVLMEKHSAPSDIGLAELRQQLQGFVLRAFRRPPTTTELDRLITLYSDAIAAWQMPTAAMHSVRLAVLTSPHFLFRFESVAKRPDGRLDAWQLASRLSYFLWTTMPDKELFACAADGDLLNRQTLEKQIGRMLRDARCQEMLRLFTIQWLELDKLDKHRSQPAGVLDAALKVSMKEETVATMLDIVSEDRSILEFLHSSHLMLNERLAAHYGIDGVDGHHFRRVPIPATSPRGGLLTQASILTLTSNAATTSAIHRAVYIMDRLLGRAPPPPPPDVDGLVSTKTGKKPRSQRERLEMHRHAPTCVNCHARFDPVGFALDHFDHVGRWRERAFFGTWDKRGRKHGQDEPINASGQLPDGRRFNGSTDLKRLLRDDPNLFVTGFVARLAQFALGRELSLADQAQVQAIAGQAKQHGYQFSKLIEALVLSDLFLCP